MWSNTHAVRHFKPGYNVERNKKMASGNQTHIDAVETAGAAQTVICGFKPRAVMFYLDDGVMGYWNHRMADASVYKRVAAGTGSLVTADGITPLVNGFTFGADSDINPGAGEIMYFTAIQ
jgi:hypothetical protein